MYVMPGRGKWMVVVDSQYIDEINKAPDEVLSFEAAIDDVSVLCDSTLDFRIRK